jgi:hypothetical protein
MQARNSGARGGCTRALGTGTLKRIGWVLLLIGGLRIGLPAAHAAENRFGEASVAFRAVTAVSGETALLDARGNVFHRTAAEALDFTAIHVEGTTAITWQEIQPDDSATDYYAISLDGNEVEIVRATDYRLRLRAGAFDPLRESAPAATIGLHAPASHRLHIVQFVTQPLSVYRQALRAQGVTIRNYLAQHAYVVEMDEATRARVSELPFVRWVGPFEPAYKLQPAIRDQLAQQTATDTPTRYRIQVPERGMRMKRDVANAITALGGEVNLIHPNGFWFEATLTLDQLEALSLRSDVLYLERWTPREADMNLAREIGGANYVESLEGFFGTGVRAEVMDTNLAEGHQDLQSIPPIFHGGRSGSASHGTSTYGINFGDGTGNELARGMVPGAQGIFADFDFLSDRYAHTAELLQPPYEAVYQSNSWGGGRTTEYTTVSAEMDDILFVYDILICNSMSNAGSQDVRPEAWAKNIVSVGGVLHRNTLTRDDDSWSFTASIGPASDGRIKPDLIHFYDDIFTIAAGGGYTNFCCTSGATPIVAGHFGVFFEMWHHALFGNPADGDTVFANRPHMSTAKAMMINSAYSYTFSGGAHDLTRTHQGWGMPDLRRMYDLRSETLIIDETDVLTEFERATYQQFVPPGEAELRATLVYTDPAGVAYSDLHRVNDVTLRLVSPSGVEYLGNDGLYGGNWTTPDGGHADTINTVENVFVEAPETGLWTIEVIAVEVNQDSHPETGADDVDFALVVSGVMVVNKHGDCDGDGDIELDDFDSLSACLAGPVAGFAEPFCACVDFDNNLNVDMVDVAEWQRAFACVPPQILATPVGAPVCPGASYTMSVEVEGNVPLLYQWFHAGTLIPGAIEPSYTISDFEPADAGEYYVEVVNNCGIVQSESALIEACTLLFEDSFETDQGWTVVSPPEMLRGVWWRSSPTETKLGFDLVQPGIRQPRRHGRAVLRDRPVRWSAQRQRRRRRTHGAVLADHRHDRLSEAVRQLCVLAVSRRYRRR